MTPMLSIEVGKEDVSNKKQEVENEIESSMMQEDDGYLSLLQGVTLNPKALLGLVTSINKVMPIFGAPAVDGKGLGPDVVRALAMIAQAIKDACDAEECPMELNFSLDELKGGDSAAQVIAGKIDRLSRTPSFKKFLKAKPVEKEEPTSPSEQPPMGDKMAMEKTAEQSPSLDSLFASRM